MDLHRTWRNKWKTGGVIMGINLYEKSHDLLELLANSIHDREPTSNSPFSFNVADIHAAEKWLTEFVNEIKEDCVCV